ncbi:unnamed protein product [Heligmosomoides polygyrus]|uniref:Uncharacterized protein n=1 Tax=Heligmosomoides polygyrus TaxID=6339 RepID=A0A183FEI1_HELPZ|nr:unnamed protein product [Heligmosomoides polygyrus]
MSGGLARSPCTGWSASDVFLTNLPDLAGPEAFHIFVSGMDSGKNALVTMGLASHLCWQIHSGRQVSPSSSAEDGCRRHGVKKADDEMKRASVDIIHWMWSGVNFNSKNLHPCRPPCALRQMFVFGPVLFRPPQ